MKISATLLSAAVAVSAAQPHRHAHQHLHKERRSPDIPSYSNVPGPIEYVYVLNGHQISEAEVQQGIKNGSLVYAENGELSTALPTQAATSTQAPSSSIKPYSAPASSSAASSSQAPLSTSQSVPSSSAAPSPSPQSYGGGQSSGNGATGVDQDFPDGQLDCSTFPSQYGALPVEWTGLGGWTGVQSPGAGSGFGGFANILTVTKGGQCSEGSFCSYACPAGYQKSQWPTTQGSTGQSVGGLHCQNGKLHLTNPELSKKLCITGAPGVTILVENKLSQNVAVCRTDYPGTESETVPVDVQPGQTDNLTCPDASNYYTWGGKATSAQYYVNPAGVPVHDACSWGSEANPWGNFAPLNIGVGYSNGAAWLSIFQNKPTTDAKLQFSVEIQGSGISGTCRYSNGQYCGGVNYGDCSPTTGCTVSLASGTATFVFSN